MGVSMTAQPQKNTAPHPRSYDDPRHPLHCPDCDPGDRIGRELRRRMEENLDLLLYEEPRGTWPFDLVRLPDAVEICENKYHLAIPEMNDPVSESETETCLVCGELAYYKRFIHWHTARPLRWIYLYSHLRRSDKLLDPQQIIGPMAEKPFCSRKCYASAVLWSRYLPVSFAQLLRILFLFPRWSAEDARERRKAEERNRKFKKNRDQVVIRLGPDTD
jgi:hypothetical protein